MWLAKEAFYRQWKETVAGLKMHIHWNRVQVSRKHYLLQVRLFQKEKLCSASQMTSTNHILFQQPYKYINLFGLLQPRVIQLLIFISSQMKKNQWYSEVWSREEGVWIFSIVLLTVRFLFEKVLRGKWGWWLVKMSNVSSVVSWKVLRTVAVMWCDGQ